MGSDLSGCIRMSFLDDARDMVDRGLNLIMGEEMADAHYWA